MDNLKNIRCGSFIRYLLSVFISGSLPLSSKRQLARHLLLNWMAVNSWIRLRNWNIQTNKMLVMRRKSGLMTIHQDAGKRSYYSRADFDLTGTARMLKQEIQTSCTRCIWWNPSLTNNFDINFKIDKPSTRKLTTFNCKVDKDNKNR